jgi:hypothetical protein
MTMSILVNISYIKQSNPLPEYLWSEKQEYIMVSYCQNLYKEQNIYRIFSNLIRTLFTVSEG